ncbi:MAG TPA: S8 family serine peptidase [Pyrinomonadaceae bacterium]|nr:S8 family serine peptidase [Pyrinomonadaceae bacterium]
MIRTLRFFAIVALLAGVVLQTLWIVSASGSTVAVIVELKDEPAAVYAARARQSGAPLSTEQLQAYRANLRATQDAFVRELEANGIAAAVTTRAVPNYDGSVAARVPLRYTLVYNGLAMNVPSSALAAIEAMPQVKKVHPDEVLRPDLNTSVEYTRATQVYGAVKELTQFDQQREGFEGQGVIVSVIDTGIDWTHPMFGGDPTPPRLAVAPNTPNNTNQKVIYYLPLADLAVNDGFGHGTHVASTVAGYLALGPKGERLHGMAPQARLMSYKVCSDAVSTVDQVVSVGGCLSSNTIMALEDSVDEFSPTGQPKPVAHVINLSLGGSGSPETPSAVAASNAALTGATVVASAGNSGRPTPTNPTGENTVGAPSAGTHVISVGASTHPKDTFSVELLQPSAVPLTRTGAVTPAKSLPAAAGFGRMRAYGMTGAPAPPANSMAQRYVLVNNVAGTWPATVAGRIALVKPQTVPTFAYVSNMAAASGAVGVVFISATTNPTAVKGSIPSVNISPEDANTLIDAMLSNDDNNVDPPNGTVSEMPLRMNPSFGGPFVGGMGDFSSKGPVRGLGQVKPDISAPGVQVMAAVPPASLLGALAAAGTNPYYIAIDGTSMASPHAAGAAALIKQAHWDWSPDMIRTAMINTATNLRNEAGVPKADGLTADRVISQGGGLIDVKEAINARALMGVTGDGITTPGILGSHSYGEVPVANSRVTSSTPVTVTIRDLSGQGGTYNLGVANSRDLQLAGIGVSLSQQSVTLPAGGEATFTVNANFDGDLLRDVMAAKTNGTQVVFELIQMQWYVTANRSDGGESLRMPFYFKPGPSSPGALTSEALPPIRDTVLAGDGGVQHDQTGYLPPAKGVTYAEYPFEVDSSVYRIEATTEWLVLINTPIDNLPDLDYELVGPDGDVVDDSLSPGGPEHVSYVIKKPGTYKHRVIGFANGPTEFTINTVLTKGAAPVTLQPLAGDFADATGKQIDFDGALTLSWQGHGNERGYEIDRSADGQSWQQIAAVGGDQAGIALANQPEGQNFYRVRSLVDGVIGLYETLPSNTASITVSRRTLEDITGLVEWAMVDNTVSYAAGVFQFDQTLTNKSANAYVPHVEFRVVGINSASGTITVANADNGGNGRSPATAALFDYSRRLGPDEVFSAGEKTGARTLRFNVPRSEMFTYDVLVTGYRGAGGGAQAAGAPAGGGASASSSSDPLGGATALLRFTANPLTRSVSAQLVSLKL